MLVHVGTKLERKSITSKRFVAANGEQTRDLVHKCKTDYSIQDKP